MPPTPLSLLKARLVRHAMEYRGIPHQQKSPLLG